MCFDKAIELHPENAEARNNKGAALGKLGRYDEALVCFDWAIEKDPINSEAWYNKGER